MSRPKRVLAAVLLGVLTLSACNDSSDTSDSSSATPGPAANTEPVRDTPEVPQTSGPLTVRQMPEPASIGSGWAERADPGAGHDDETAPDAPSTQQRDVDELMDGLVPIGCPQAAVDIALPRPRYALERTYAGPAGQPGVALVLQFADNAGPEDFLGAFERQLRACPDTGADPDGPITVGYRSVERTSEILYGLRQERGVDADPNRYLVIAVRDGNRVGLAYLSGVRANKAVTIGANLIKAIRQG